VRFLCGEALFGARTSSVEAIAPINAHLIPNCVFSYLCIQAENTSVAAKPNLDAKEAPPNVALADILRALRFSARDSSYDLRDVESMICSLLEQVCDAALLISALRACDSFEFRCFQRHRST